MTSRLFARTFALLWIPFFLLEGFPVVGSMAARAMPQRQSSMIQSRFNVTALQDSALCFHEFAAGHPLIGKLVRSEASTFDESAVSRRGVLARWAGVLALGAFGRNATAALALQKSLTLEEKARAQAAYTLLLRYLPTADRTLLENGKEYYGIAKMDLAKLFEGLDKILILPRPLDTHSESVAATKNPQNLTWTIYISPGDFANFAALLADLAYETAGILDAKYGLATGEKTHNQVIMQATERALRTLRAIRNDLPPRSKSQTAMDVEIQRLVNWQIFWRDAPATKQAAPRPGMNLVPAPGRKMNFYEFRLKPDDLFLRAG